MDGTEKGERKVKKGERKVKTIITLGDTELTVIHTHIRASRGYREKGGLQIEPDESAHEEVEDILLAGTDISLYSLIEDLNGLDVIEAKLALEDNSDEPDYPERDEDE